MVMAKHGIRFMEVPSIGDWSAVCDQYVGVPGFTALCEQTGASVATCDGDGWSNPGLYSSAPADPIERLLFAMDRRCFDHEHHFIQEQ
jgi:hypothetical protein